MTFKVTPKSSFENQRKPPLFRIIINDVRKGAFVKKVSPSKHIKKSKKKSRECHSHKKGKRKVQGVAQSQTAALSRPQEEEETDKSKQAQTEQTHEKH